MNPSVLLVKSSKKSSVTDSCRYESLLLKKGFNVLCVDPFTISFVNLEQLQLIIDKNRDNYTGVVFTSVQALEAFAKCLRAEHHVWSGMNCYVVGPACEERAVSLGFTKCVGSNTGNARALSGLLLKSLNKSSDKILFPCGNIAKDTVCESLKNADIFCEPFVCYSTEKNPTLDEDLRTIFAINSVNLFIMFSPSAVRFIAETDAVKEKEVSFVAVGPSTAEEIVSMGLKLAAVAVKPNPSSVVEAVEEHFNQSCSTSNV